MTTTNRTFKSSIHNENDRAQLAARIHTLQPHSVHQWGKMTVAREAWLASLEDYAGYSADIFFHDFFGPLSHEVVGAFVWKHADHHLKQFGA